MSDEICLAFDAFARSQMDINVKQAQINERIVRLLRPRAPALIPVHHDYGGRRNPLLTRKRPWVWCLKTKR